MPTAGGLPLTAMILQLRNRCDKSLIAVWAQPRRAQSTHTSSTATDHQQETTNEILKRIPNAFIPFVNGV